MTDEYDHEAVFERLVAEIRGLQSALTKAYDALHCDQRTERLTLHGGIAELRRQRDAAEEEVKALKKELDRLIHDKRK